MSPWRFDAVVRLMASYAVHQRSRPLTFWSFLTTWDRCLFPGLASGRLEDGDHIGGFLRAVTEVVDLTSTHIPSARTHSYELRELQGMPGNVTQL